MCEYEVSTEKIVPETPEEKKQEKIDELGAIKFANDTQYNIKNSAVGVIGKAIADEEVEEIQQAKEEYAKRI